MRIVLALLLLFAAVILAVQNATAVTISFWFWRVDAPLAIIVALSFALGAVGGILLSAPRLYRMRSHERQLRAQLADLDRDEPPRDALPTTPADFKPKESRS